MVLLAERDIIHLIMLMKRQPSEKVCKEILIDNTGAFELLDIVICSLFYSKGVNLKTVQF